MARARCSLLQAWWLETANRLRQRAGFPHHRQGWLLVVAGVAGTLALLTRWLPRLAGVAGGYLPAVGILMALQSAVFVHLGRLRWSQFYSRGWLATVPVHPRVRTGMIALRACWPPITVALAAAAAMFAAPSPHGAAPGIGSSEALACLLGTLVGLPLGWWLPQRRLQPAPAASGVRSATRAHAPLSGLVHWPGRQVQAWLQPRSLARLGVLALALPMDMPANMAVALFCVLAIAVYLAALLRATVHVAREGAMWLRPTPLSAGRFAWAVLRYPLVGQLQWTALGAVLLAAMGADPGRAIRAAELWLAWFSAISSLALAEGCRARGLTLQMLLSATVLAGIESLKAHLALPCALLFAGWQLRRAARS